MDPEVLQSVALASSAARSVDSVLTTIVDGLSTQPGCALARIWLIRPGDPCNECVMREVCPDQSRCLHLVASAGASVDGSTRWDGLDGQFRRMPIGVRKVGLVAESGKPFLIDDIQADTSAIVLPDWAAAERVRSFAGQPLIFRGEVLGVLALFRREPLNENEHRWLRTFADHAAVSIANARAFEEIGELKSRLQDERDYLREEVKEAQAFGDIIGSSDALRTTLDSIDLVAPTDANVLILGESGTGKEMVARAIHERSPRREQALVRVNCASVPKELFESEFFGHARGAFTGAVKDRPGRFQVADGGTLFLDEVGEIPLELQGKLLRVLQEGQFERVGEDRTRHVDVRIVAATNRDLEKEARAGRFREDLYYRLSVFPVELPPLRQRKGDVGPLANHFLELAASRFNRPVPVIARAELDALESYDWPGNIRELQNVIERAMILTRGDRLALDRAMPQTANGTPRLPTPDPAPGRSTAFVTEAELRQRERDNIIAALDHADGKVYGAGGAAELLGMKPSTLASRIKTLEIKR